MRRSFSYIRYGNCLFFLIYLRLTGRLSKILLRPGETISNNHWMGITKKGNVIHLTTNKNRYGKTGFEPLLMIGRPEIFIKEQLRKVKYKEFL